MGSSVDYQLQTVDCRINKALDSNKFIKDREITGEREKTALVRMGQASLEVALLVSQER